MVRFLSCFLIAQLASAATQPEDPLQQGRKDLKAQQWIKAEKTLTRAAERDSQSADAQALLGMARYHLGNLKDAASHLTKALELRTSYPSRTLYYKGLCEAGLGRAQAAEATFTQLASMYPYSPEARKLNIMPQDLQDSIARKETFLITGTIVSGEAGYNSNPTQQADGESDLFIDAFASSDMKLGRSAWSIGGSVFSETYLDDSDNNYISLSADLTRKIQLEGASVLQAIAAADTSRYGGESYERNIGILLVHSRVWDEVWSSELRAGYESATDISDAGGADASHIGARARLAARSSNGSILQRTRFELELRDEDNDTTWLGSQDVSAAVEFRTRPFGNASLDLGIEYSSSSYDDEDPVDAITRDDTSVELSAYLFAPVSSSAALTAQISHDMRSSNISEYDADETIISVGVSVFP